MLREQMTTADAGGLSCPQPVLLTHSTLKAAQSGQVEVLVDTETSRDTCTRAAQKEGWQVQVLEEGTEYRLILTR